MIRLMLGVSASKPVLLIAFQSHATIFAKLAKIGEGVPALHRSDLQIGRGHEYDRH